MDKKVIKSVDAPTPIGPYSQAVRAGNFLFLSGQIAINPQSNTLVSGSIEDESEQIMRNIEAVLAAEGLTFDAVVKTTIFLKEMSSFESVNAVYARYFSHSFPARETVAVSGLPKNVRVEISMIAHAPAS